MRYPTILCGFVTTFMCPARNANAQYIPAHNHRDRADFMDNYGQVLPYHTLIDLGGASRNGMGLYMSF